MGISNGMIISDYPKKLFHKSKTIYNIITLATLLLEKYLKNKIDSWRRMLTITFTSVLVTVRNP